MSLFFFACSYFLHALIWKTPIVVFPALSIFRNVAHLNGLRPSFWVDDVVATKDEDEAIAHDCNPPPPFRSPELPERAGTFCRNVVILGGSMFFSENACCYCQLLSSTLPVTLLFVHPPAEMLKCCFCGSEGASMTDFHDLQLKE